MNNSFLLTFIKRLVVILIFIVVILLTAYSCNAINTVSNYKLNLEAAIGRIYQSEDQNILLSINSAEEAYLHSKEETGLFKIVPKDNLLYLEQGEGENVTRTIFVPLDEDRIFWQAKNTYLYYWEREE